MSQCVPGWDLHNNNPPRPSRSEYEIAELTWENGQVAMHGFGLPRLPNSKPSSWDKPRATGTLESIVNQATATSLPRFSKLPFDQTLELTSGNNSDNHLMTWFDNHQRCSVTASGAPSNNVTMDALVPNCRRNNNNNNNNQHEEHNSSYIMDSFAGVNNNNGCSTRVASCSAAAAVPDRGKGRHVASAARVPSTPEWSSRSGSATFGVDSQQVTIDTKGSDRDSVCHGRLEREGSDEEEMKKRSMRKFSVSTKKRRAAAVHNQSERKRRDKINQRMKTLQKLVPNSSKTDKASMLDEVIDYLKQLQAQVNVIKNMNMPAMMLPLAMQQELQMSMMAQRNMGMGMPGMGMDMNIMNRPNIAGVAPLLQPMAFMPMMTSWDVSPGGGGERLPGGSAAVIPDHLSAFLACVSQPMSMEAYSMMAAMYQKFQ